MAKRTQARKSAAASADRRLVAIRAHDDNKEPVEEFVLVGSAQAIRRMARADDADMRDNFGAKAIEDFVIWVSSSTCDLR